MDSILRRYILIREWVSDEDVARELFMRIWGEEALLRAANRWRAQQGLPPAEPVPIDADIGFLHPEEEEEARRLYRRGLIRCRWLVVGAFIGAVLLSLSIHSALRSPTQHLKPPGTNAHLTPIDPERLTGSHPAVVTQYGDSISAPYRFHIHRAEATEGSVRVWWSISGPFTGDEVPALPVLAGGPPGRQQRFMPSSYHVSYLGNGRFGGESRYLLPGSTDQTVYLYWSPTLVNPFVWGTDAIRVDDSAIRIEVLPEAVVEPILARSTRPGVLMTNGLGLTVEEVQVTEDFIAVVVGLNESWKYTEVSTLLSITGSDRQRRLSYAERAGGSHRMLYFPRVPGDTESVTVTLAHLRQDRVWLDSPQVVERNMSPSGDLTITLIDLPDLFPGEDQIFYFPTGRTLRPSYVDRSRYPWLRYMVLGAEDMPTALFYYRLEPEKGHTLRIPMQQQ